MISQLCLKKSVMALMAVICGIGTAWANNNSCASLPNHATLKAALTAALADAFDGDDMGLDLQMWATIVDRDGVVCAVAFSGTNRGAQWPGSRVISAQKANTANAFSLDSSSSSGGSGAGAGLALSTANLYTAVQPGGSLFGLQESNPVNTKVAYKSPSANYGKPNDPMVGEKIGGVNVFGGGLALYAQGGIIVGAVGVSGDTSCADHHVAYRLRHNLNLDFLSTVPGPASLFAADATHPDNIILESVTPGTGFGHPDCLNTGDPSTLPAVQ
jgi:uncharacterized protein GlcG (DUF336 family)